MSYTPLPLEDQALDLDIKRLLDLGVTPYKIYASVARVGAEVRATDDEIETAITLVQGNYDITMDVEPWATREDAWEDADMPARVWVHVWLRLGDE